MSPYKLRLMPTLAVFLFMVQMGVIFFQADALWSDPGSGQQLRGGSIMWTTHSIPRTDPFTWTLPGAPWTAYDWLSSVIYSGLAATLGLGAATGFGLALFALVPVIVFRRCLSHGVDPVPAFVLSCALLVGIQPHVLIRPHAFTYFFFALAVHGFWPRLRRMRMDRYWWLALAILAVVNIFWVNLHPGFASGILFFGLSVAGRAMDVVLRKGKGLVRVIAGGLTVGIVLLIVTGLNPHGWGLHAGVGKMMGGMKSVRLMQEFQPPDFFHPNAMAAMLLVFVLGLVVTQVQGLPELERWEWKIPLIVLGWFAFQSQRHIPLFLIVAAVPLARSLHGWCQSVAGRERVEGWRGARRRQAGSRGDWIGIPMIGVALTILFCRTTAGRELEPGNANVSVEARRFIGGNLEKLSRPLTTTRNGGTLIYYFYGRMPVSFDDRNAFYGDEINLRQFRLIAAAPGWRDLLEQGSYESAILSPGDELVQGMELLPAWRKIFADEVTVVFVKARKDAP